MYLRWVCYIVVVVVVVGKDDFDLSIGDYLIVPCMHYPLIGNCSLRS